MPVYQTVFDELLDDSLELLRLSAGERKKVLKQIEALEKELKLLLVEGDFSKFSRAQINRVLANANATIGKYYAAIQTSVPMQAIGEYAADATALSLEVALGVEALAVPTTEYFKSLKSDILIQGSPAKDWWQQQSISLQNKFAQQIRIGAAAGETNQQLITRTVGILAKSKSDAAALVHTSVQTVASDARRNTFKANSDIIKGMRQVSTLDGHTSDICIAYSGAEWDLDGKPINGSTLPYVTGVPRHFRCRSSEVPITKTFRELGIDIDEPKGTTRASSDGQIDVDTSFDSFLTRKGKGYQDKMLGAGRADLWRSNKIKLRDLVDGQGRPRTLEQLKALVQKRRSK